MNQSMQVVRVKEQKKVAVVGEYADIQGFIDRFAQQVIERLARLQ
jgi:hypothetical protein